MTFDLQRARLETPGTAHVLHFNNAGSALLSQPVLDATIAYLQREAQIGGYETATKAHEALENTSLAAAKLIGVKQPDLSNILRGHYQGFSLERLMRMLTAFDHDVEITVRPRRGKSKTGGRITFKPLAA